MDSTRASTPLPSSSAKRNIRGRPLGCIVCNTYVTHTAYLVSDNFKGYRGQAALYSYVSEDTTVRSPARTLTMRSGAYTVRALRCRSCGGYLGWHVERAHTSAGRWQEGNSMLEQTCVGDQSRRDRLEAARRDERLRMRPPSRTSSRKSKEDRSRPATCMFNFPSVLRKIGGRRRKARTGAEGVSSASPWKRKSAPPESHMYNVYASPLPATLAETKKPRKAWGLGIRRAPVKLAFDLDKVPEPSGDSCHMRAQIVV